MPPAPRPARPAPKRGRALVKKLRSRGHGTLHECDLVDVRDVDVTDIDLESEDLVEEFGTYGSLPARYEVLRYSKVLLPPREEYRGTFKVSHGAYVLQVQLLSRISSGPFLLGKSCLIKVWLQDVKGRFSMRTVRGKLANRAPTFHFKFDVPVDRKFEVVIHVTSPSRLTTHHFSTLLQKLSEHERFSSEASTATLASA